MTFGAYERLSLYVTVGLSLLLIASTGELAAQYYLIAALGLAGRIGLERRSMPGPMPSATIPALIAFAFFIVDVFWLATNILMAVTDFVLLLLFAKLLGDRRVRDNLQIIGLSFLLVLSATVMMVEALFGLLFLGYVFASLWALILQNLRTQWEAAGNETRVLERRHGVLGRAFGVAVVGLGVGIIAFTLIFYFAFPRVGLRWGSNPFGHAERSAGFSDQVRLNDIGRINANPAVAVRVEFPGGIPPEKNSLRRLRGTVLDSFDGQMWIDSGDADRRPVRAIPNPASGWRLRNGVRKGSLRVIPEAQYRGNLFLPREAVHLYGEFNHIARTSTGNFLARRGRSNRLSYQIDYGEGALEDAAPVDSHLAIPPSLAEPLEQSIRELAPREAEGAALAQALTDGLRGQYLYTLDVPPLDEQAPLADFLRRTRTGHCELFASSLALMLRARGIPTRIVNGFAGGEVWDDSSVVFRELHAHSWVEAWLPERGWVEFDPTPTVVGQLAWHTRAVHAAYRLVDRVRFWWGLWFVEYDFERQAEIAGNFRGASTQVGRRLNEFLGNLRSRPIPEAVKVGLAAVLLVPALTLAVVLAVRNRRRGGRLEASRVQRLYRRRLRLAERRAVRHEGETVLRFARDLAHQDARWVPFLEYTELYYRLRFGSAAAQPADGLRFLELHARLPALIKGRGRRPVT